MSTAPFVIERVYNAPIEAVWQAITDNEKMKQWYFKLDEFKPEVGFKFSFMGGDKNKQYLHLCEIIEVVEGRKLVHTWRYDGYEGDTTVTWELFADGDKTRLKLTHAGLETLPQEDAFKKENFAKGWTYITGTSLQNFISPPAP